MTTTTAEAMMTAAFVPRNKLLGLRLLPEEHALLDDLVKALEKEALDGPHPGLKYSKQDAIKIAITVLAREKGVVPPAASPKTRPKKPAR